MKFAQEDYNRVVTALEFYKKHIEFDSSVAKSQKDELISKIDETITVVETIGSY